MNILFDIAFRMLAVVGITIYMISVITNQSADLTFTAMCLDTSWAFRKWHKL